MHDDKKQNRNKRDKITTKHTERHTRRNVDADRETKKQDKDDIEKNPMREGQERNNKEEVPNNRKIQRHT